MEASDYNIKSYNTGLDGDNKAPPLTVQIDESQKVNLTKEIKDLLHITFDAFDVNKSGSINLTEFRNVIKILGFKMSKNKIYEIFKEFDEDESGNIEFDEFLNLMINYLVL